MKKKVLWQDCLYEDNINGINFDSIMDFSYRWKNECLGRVVSNVGGWQSPCYFHSGKKCNELDKVISIIQKKIKHFNKRFGKILDLDCLWININPTGSFNKVHDHLGGPIFSGVLYINAKKGMGNIVFIKTFNILNVSKDDQNIYSSEHFPSTGKMFIFPADLLHYVKENEDVEDRVSISFNLSYC